MSEEMFKEAVQAVRAGQRRRAKDLLTRLIKADSSNVDYWVWMSASVDTEKEQIFCLQNALKLDPNSVAARRGLVVLGALKPEEAGLAPTPVSETGPIDLPVAASGSALARLPGPLGGFLGRPRNREMALLAVLGVAALGMVGIVIAALLNPNMFRPRQVAVAPTNTPRPSATFTPTATQTQAAAVTCGLPATPDPSTPLAVHLCLTQTATPVPVATEASVSEAYNSLKRDYGNGDWDRIIGPRATAAIADQPNNVRVYFYIAEAYRHLGGRDNLAQAVQNYRTALQKDASFAPAYWGRARAEFLQDRPAEALKDLDSAIKADPGFIPAFLDRASYYLARGNPSGALADLEQARLTAPRNALVLANLALAYVESSRPQEALDSAGQALAIDPGLALGYYARGRAEYALGQLEVADADLSLSYRYVLDLDVPLASDFQASVFYYYGLGKVSLNDDATALTLFTQSLGDPPRPYPLVYVARGNVHLRAADYEEARADFNTAIGLFQRNDPNINQAYLGNGMALLGLNRPDSALSNFQVVVRADPSNFEGHWGLGRAQLGTGRAEAALESFNAALALATEPAQTARVYFWRAQAFEALGQTAEQIADLSALAELDDLLAPTAQAQLTAIGPLPTATLSVTVTPTLAAVTLTPTRGTPARTPTATRTP